MCLGHCGRMRGRSDTFCTSEKAFWRGKLGSWQRLHCEEIHGGEKADGLGRNHEETHVAEVRTVRQEMMSIEIGDGGRAFVSMRWALSCG